MRAVVGLGNPGIRYAGTRHNVGFMVIEELARRWRVSWGPSGDSLRLAPATVGEDPVLLVEPQMYMNLSGEALAKLTPPPPAAALIVVHDDVDLETGRVRVKCGGGTGGHRGLESIRSLFGDEFTRVRIGVGRPPAGQDTASHVLSPFNDDEREPIRAAVERAADAVECILRQGEQFAMNVFNRRPDTTTAAAPIGRE